MISRDSALNEIKPFLKTCIDRFYASDSVLFERNGGEGVCERSLVFRFAYHLQNMIQNNFFVDCDFNSSSFDGGERHGKPIRNNDGTETGRFVDIIIHKRDSNSQNNIICFEIKKWNSQDADGHEKDRNNLCSLTSEYGYVYGFHLTLHRMKAETKWSIFRGGTCIQEEVKVF